MLPTELVSRGKGPNECGCCTSCSMQSVGPSRRRQHSLHLVQDPATASTRSIHIWEASTELELYVMAYASVSPIECSGVQVCSGAGSLALQLIRHLRFADQKAHHAYAPSARHAAMPAWQPSQHKPGVVRAAATRDTIPVKFVVTKEKTVAQTDLKAGGSCRVVDVLLQLFPEDFPAPTGMPSHASTSNGPAGRMHCACLLCLHAANHAVPGAGARHALRCVPCHLQALRTPAAEAGST